ncbi:MAG: S8 family peptidase [Sulfuricurvum sp.]|nr:S8 family peptidase [Sulfuricurvum sp.]
MKTQLIVLTLIAAALLFFSGCRESDLLAVQINGKDMNVSYTSGEVIVVYKESIRKSAIDTLHRQCGARVKQELLKSGSKRIDLITLPESMSVEEGIAYYKQRPEVESVEPNRIIKKYKTVPNDTNLSGQWHLDRTFDVTQSTLVDMNATSAWDTTQGDSQITVAVIDTGIDSSHPDLRNQLWHNALEGVIADGVDNDNNGYVDDAIGYDFVNRDYDPNDDDVDGHGTHVSGLIAAEGNNSTGTSGVAWHASVMALKILDADGYGETAAEVEAIRYAVDNGARIINMSLGGGCGDEASPAEYAALSYARDHNVLVVVAAGNDGCNNDGLPTYPAGHPLDNLLVVGAVNKSGSTAWFSNYGSYSVHLSAPGEDILSTVPVAKGSYDLMSGTSMATPIVSGSAVVVLANDSNLTYKQLREKLIGSAVSSPLLNGKNLISGLLDVGSALVWQAQNHPPIKPSLYSLRKSDTNVSLSWMDYSTVETSYRVKRAAGTQTNVTKEWSLAPDSVQFSDTEVSLDEGSVYYYWVEAHNSFGDTPSNVMTLNIPLAAPVISSISASYGNQVVLAWNDLSKVEEGYIIYRSSSFWGGFTEIARVGADAIGYTDTTTRGETIYYYMVKAYQGGNFSDESNLVQIFTPKELLPGNCPSGGGGAFNLSDILLLVMVLIGLGSFSRREGTL